MDLFKILCAVICAAGLGAFYYLMALRKGSPQRKLGKDFKMPDVRLHYSPEMLYNTYEDAGEDGRGQMRLYWLYDFGLIACLLGVMLAVSANIADGRAWVYPLMLWLTIARTAADVLEDILLLSLLRRFPQRRMSPARLVSGVTAAKHLLLIAWLLSLFMVLFLKAFGI